jgi:low affinity Fe/Cu permease
MTRIIWAFIILTILILTALACVRLYGLPDSWIIIDHAAFTGGIYIMASSLMGIMRSKGAPPLTVIRRMFRLVIGASVTAIHIMQYFRDLV